MDCKYLESGNLKDQVLNPEGKIEIIFDVLNILKLLFLKSIKEGFQRDHFLRSIYSIQSILSNQRKRQLVIRKNTKLLKKGKIRS